MRLSLCGSGHSEGTGPQILTITVLWAEGYKSTVRDFMARLAESRDTVPEDAEQDWLEERIDRVRDLRDFRFQVIVRTAVTN